MGSSRLTPAAGIGLALILLLQLVVYQVNETETAVVLTFGKASGTASEPGPGLKWPWPIQEVKRFDARLQVLEGPFEQVLTEDKRSLLVGSFLVWRVSDPQKFMDEVGEVEAAEITLRTALRSAQSAALGQIRFADLVSTDPSQLRYPAVEEAMRNRITEQLAAQPIGVEVSLVGIRRLGLPKDVTEAVFERMREERNARAEEILAQGRNEAGKIRAQAEQEKQQAIDKAELEARTTLAKAEETVAQIRAEAKLDPELYVFVYKLEALKKMLEDQTTLVFDFSQPPFDLLAGAPGQAANERSADEGEGNRSGSSEGDDDR